MVIHRAGFFARVLAKPYPYPRMVIVTKLRGIILAVERCDGARAPRRMNKYHIFSQFWLSEK